MIDNKEKDSNERKKHDEDKEIHIEPSESGSSKTGDPGRTPGKAEGEDDDSATE